MMHPQQVITSTSSKRGHTCSHGIDGGAGCSSCGPAVSKRTGTVKCSNGGEGGGEDAQLADSLFSLVTVAEQQRQAQERGGEQVQVSSFAANHHFPLSCSAPATLSSRQSIYPPAERLITFTTASREYPHLRPVPLQELASLKLFRTWVRRSFELKDEFNFILVDRSVEAKNEEDSGLIDSDVKLVNAKDIEIVEVLTDEADRSERDNQEALSNSSNGLVAISNNTQAHHNLFLYAKSILLFLSEKGNVEARSIVAACPASFTACPPLTSLPSDTSSAYPSLSLPLHGSAGALLPTSPTHVAPPALPRIVAQAPPCLIPGYYIFSPVFDSFGEKRKLPIKIEIPRALVFNGERYKTVSTYIGLGPFGNDPNSFIKLEGDHLVGTTASRLEDDEEGGATNNGSSPHMCTYVFKNLRLKTRSLIRTVLDVSYNGMRTGRFFFMVDNEVLPNTSRRFEIKAPSGYTIKMVNKTARSNPVAKHAHPTSPPTSQPSSPSLPSSRPPSPPESPHLHPLSHSQPLPSIPSIALTPCPKTPPSQTHSPTSSSSPFHQLQLPPSILMQLNKHKQTDSNPQSPPPTPRAQLSQSQTQLLGQSPQQTQLYQQLQSFLNYSPQQHAHISKLPKPATPPPTIPKGFTNATPNAQQPLAPMHTQLHTQTQQSTHQPPPPQQQRTQSPQPQTQSKNNSEEPETSPRTPTFPTTVNHGVPPAAVLNVVHRPVIA